MSFFKKLKNLFGKEENTLSHTKKSDIILENNNILEDVTLRETPFQQPLNIREWLYALNPQWQEILVARGLSDTHSEEELAEYLKKITVLEISGKKIKDFTPLKVLVFLKSLELNGTQIANLTPLKTLTELKELKLYHSYVKDLNPLATLTQLREVSIWNSEKTAINTNALGYLYALEELKIENIATSLNLKNCSALKVLEINNSDIESLAGLENCTAIQEIHANHCPIKSLKGLENCSELQVLEMSNNFIKDVEPLKNATQLKHLNAFHCEKLKDISALQHCTALEELFLGSTSINDLTPLYKLPNLVALGIPSYLRKKTEAFKEVNPTCEIVFYGS